MGFCQPSSYLCRNTKTACCLVSATSRSLLTQDQAHIAVGGREHIISLMYFWLARMKSCDGLP